jgi:hypothetical protein
MLFLRRIAQKGIFFQLPPGHVSLTRRSSFLFATLTMRQKIESVHSKLIGESQQLSPKIIVQMMHFVHFKSQKESEDGLLTGAEVDRLVSELSSNIFKLTHAEITLLLETLS